MAIVYSDQRTKDTAIPSKKVAVNERHGRVRIARFSYTTPATGLTLGDIIELTILPIGARVIYGSVWWEAMGAGCTAGIGVTGTAGKYLATGTDVSGVSQANLANTQALNMNAVTAAEETVILTTAGGNYAATKKIDGFILYVVD